jgi:hypothetical protein
MSYLLLQNQFIQLRTICFSSKQFSSEKKQKHFHSSSKSLLQHFLIEHLEEFLSNAFFLIDQKEKFKKYFQQSLKQLEKK